MQQFFMNIISCALLGWKDDTLKEIKQKHVFSKFYVTYDLKKSGDLNIQQICSCDNLECFLQSNSKVKCLSKTGIKDWYLSSQRWYLV